MVGWVGGAGGEGAWVSLLEWDALLIFSAVVVAVWVALFLRGVIGVRRTRVLVPRVASEALDVTVFVPARDEEEIIGRSLSSVLAEPVASVVVVDDRSTDGTASVLAGFADARLRVIEGIGPAPGECGKPAALVHAWSVAPATTEWVLFLDADVVLERGAVAALIGAAGREIDLVSVIPRVTLSSPIERLVMPSIGALILAANDKKPFANGQVILIRRSLYEKIGTHRSVISELLEDVRLAERASYFGGRLLLADGRRLASTHMYSGWAELVEGWQRNLYLLTGGTKASAYRWIAFTTLMTWLGPAAAIIEGVPGLIAWALIALMQAVLRALGGAPALYAPLAPLSALLVDYVLLRSLRLHEEKRPIKWKNRAY